MQSAAGVGDGSWPGSSGWPLGGQSDPGQVYQRVSSAKTGWVGSTYIPHPNDCAVSLVQNECHLKNEKKKKKKKKTR